MKPKSGIETQHTPGPSQEALIANCAEALRMIGQAGKILEQMEEFWSNGTAVRPGSLLAIEFSEWGKRLMTGPVLHTKRLYDAAPDLLAACEAFLPLATDAKCIQSVKWTEARDKARAALAKAKTP